MRSMVVVPVPPTPGMDQADVDTSEWVLEFLKSFGGRLEQNAATYVAALETEGYDSQRNLMQVSVQELRTAGLLAGDAKTVMAQLQLIAELAAGVKRAESDAAEDWDLKIKWPVMAKGCGPYEMISSDEALALVEKAVLAVRRRSLRFAKTIQSVVDSVDMTEGEVTVLVNRENKWEDTQLSAELQVEMPSSVHAYLKQRECELGSGLHTVWHVLQSREVTSHRSVASATAYMLKPRAPTSRGELFGAVADWEKAKQVLTGVGQLPSEWQRVEGLEWMVKNLSDVKAKVDIRKGIIEDRGDKVVSQDIVNVVKPLADEWRGEASQTANLAAAVCEEWRAQGSCSASVCDMRHPAAEKGNIALPKPRGKRKAECPTWRRDGRCRFGANCRFEHEGYNTHPNPNSNSKSIRNTKYNPNGVHHNPKPFLSKKRGERKGWAATRASTQRRAAETTAEGESSAASTCDAVPVAIRRSESKI